MGQHRQPSPSCLGLPLLTFRGFVHRVPELEARRMFVPQFLQLGPQQDVLLCLWGTGPSRQEGWCRDCAWRHLLPNGSSARPPVGHTFDKASRKADWHSSPRPLNTLTPFLLISPQEQIKAADEDVRYKCSLQTVFNVVGKCSPYNGEWRKQKTN